MTCSEMRQNRENLYAEIARLHAEVGKLIDAEEEEVKRQIIEFIRSADLAELRIYDLQSIYSIITGDDYKPV